MKKNSLAILFLITILIPANMVPAFSQTNSNLENFLVELSLSPSQVDVHNSTHSVGYVNLVGKNGLAIKAPQDITVGLESDDSSIADVPSAVTILKGQNFATFNIQTKDKNGETTISTLFNDKIDFKNFRVGGADDSMPDGINLKINFPTERMHVNSEMPFSVYLETSEGDIIRAPYDIEINLNYEKSLLRTNTDSMTIKKGTYYAWGVINTNEVVGNGFLRASFDHLGIDTSKNIEITSSLPVALAINVFPEQISADVNRNIDVFVSLVDSDGLPAVTPVDVKLELFSDEDAVGKKLDERMKNTNVVIKTGEFGYYFREKMNLAGFEGREIMIGVSAKDLGIALDNFKTVKPLNINNPLAENRTLSLFVLPQIPSKTSSILVYQIMAKAGGADDCKEEVNEEGETICVEEINKKDVHPIEELKEGELYPVQANENFASDGIVDKINIISSDSSIINIENDGSVESSYSYGTAIISSGQKNGEVTLATTVKGIGAGTIKSEVIDVFKHTTTKIFSPTGPKKIVVDKNGYFDLFLIALDGKSRPKILEKDTKYILNPVNDVLEIKKNRSFASANFLSDSFNVIEGKPITVTAVPIGVEAELDLEALTSFESQISSRVEIELPFKNLDANSQFPYNGVVQLRDLLGNPTSATKDVRINLNLDGTKIVKIPEFVTIPQGSAYATFPISSNGQNGDATIGASIKGVLGTETKISTVSNEPKLKIFAEGIEGALNIGEPGKLTIFIDDENAKSVPGAMIKFVTQPGVTVTPSNTRTDETGTANVDVTANDGELVSIEILASASGYSDGKQSFNYEVAGAPNNSLALGLPEWVVYVGVAAMIGIAVVIIVFLKKPKASYEDEDEEYEYEDEI
ncbi:MAG TPA: hypothetical protein VD731_02495 [Nitrosopumilaceae archaeon]|nr:hypothetical protein [Nitrosopumilaceae archaeon]